MKTITIRDLRQRWPETEKSLQVENEIVITRDGEPVAKLVRLVKPQAKRKRWNPEEHMKWIKKIYGNKVFPSIDEELAAARADRKLI
jgi:antitoxin (DNA-binding transcriptional repressor) of toxin-antitoxin stability system